MSDNIDISEKHDFGFRKRYETLRALLNSNGNALQILSDLEADLHHLPSSDWRIQRPVSRLIDEVFLMAQDLNLLTNSRFTGLYETLELSRKKTFEILRKTVKSQKKSLVVRLNEEKSNDSGLVGGKTSGVSFLYTLFPDFVPDAFVLTTDAYRIFLEKNNLIDKIRLLLNDLDVITDHDNFALKTESIRKMIYESELPASIVDEINKQVKIIKGIGDAGWAVRSSAIDEDGRFSFAGQFETILGVETSDLAKAYRKVIASRFLDRAIIYRINCGLKEVDTPMAVLLMPLIDAKAAGVIHTRDAQNPNLNIMVVNAVKGLADKLVKGLVTADTFYIKRQLEPEKLDFIPGDTNTDKNTISDYLSEATLCKIGNMAYKAMEAFGSDLDIEWAVDKNDKIWLLQSRRLMIAEVEKHKEIRITNDIPLIEGGITIFPGRSEGQVIYVTDKIPSTVPKGSILIVEQPSPDLAPLLPKLAAFLASKGSPIGHLATLLREFSVPSIFRLGDTIKRIKDRDIISVDSTNRKIYNGSRWPGIKDRVLARLSSDVQSQSNSPLFNLVLSLHLTDPFSSKFKAKNCQSIHDVVRFIHEMAVRAMFHFGDAQNKLFHKRAKPFNSGLPMKIYTIDIDRPYPTDTKEIFPNQIESIPFKALWAGVSDDKLPWPERWDREFKGLPSDFKEQVLGGLLGPRRAKDVNYLMVAKDYLNFNARFAYHYAMVDTIVGEGDHNNYVHFRFHGGGAGDIQKQRRSRFVEWILRESGFGVDRRGDLIIAWLRRYPQKESLDALAGLGRIMVCARQLDVLMKDDAMIKMYAENFLAGNYSVFVL
ncbi:MAG: pyruvate, water dikinase [Desulfobacterales bacterium]|nr:pyruvate, water dikinase [Desulfobacterales bacterium]